MSMYTRFYNTTTKIDVQVIRPAISQSSQFGWHHLVVSANEEMHRAAFSISLVVSANVALFFVPWGKLEKLNINLFLGSSPPPFYSPNAHTRVK